ESDAEEQLLWHIEDCGPFGTRLTLGTLNKEAEYACLEIGDTGCGMSRVIMEHAFEPFFTTKPVDKGTGLGLATVHGVIVSHKGILVLDSSIGEGTRFRIFFPLAAAKLQKEPPCEQEDMICGTGRILLVEDQEEVKTMTLTMLRRLGYAA